jgi:hypothetical protein
MASDPKLKQIGARKAPDSLSINTLLTFAEKVIQTDKDALLKAQSAIFDLTAGSNDTAKRPKFSALAELCGSSRGVKIQSSLKEEAPSEKLVDLNSLRRKP